MVQFSKNAFGGGTNNQNLTDEMREMFIPDEGKKLAYADLEQAESKAVARLSGDEAYIKACDSGDLHTFVSRMIWPGLGWDMNLKHDKEIAEQQFYRHFSYRDMSKRGGHLTNYKGKPATMSHHLKITLDLATRFQNSYFQAFPGIPEWHGRVARDLATHSKMTTKLGFMRWFFGRLQDEATIREAVAFEPQVSGRDDPQRGALSDLAAAGPTRSGDPRSGPRCIPLPIPGGERTGGCASGAGPNQGPSPD